MSANLPRLPIRFLPEHAEMLKSQTDEVDFKKGIAELDAARDALNTSHGTSLIAKSIEALSGGHADAGTDWKATEPVIKVPEGVVSNFHAPGDRNIGNVLFRRNPDASLDVESAKHVVVDMIHKVKDKLPLTELEKITLGIIFPLIFDFVDPRLSTPMMSIHLRLTAWEVTMLQERVSAHLAAEMSYNAGLGGFPTEHPRS